jgi:hypothetical protein
VIVVQNRAFSEGFKNIVLPLSNQIDPRQAVRWALMMNWLFKSQVHIFQSFETDHALKSRLDIIAMQITRLFSSKNVSYSIESAPISGSFSSQVVDYATRLHSDMIMIMTRPNGESLGFNLSAWDEKIMFNQDQIAVMCINPVRIGIANVDWMS